MHLGSELQPPGTEVPGLLKGKDECEGMQCPSGFQMRQTMISLTNQPVMLHGPPCQAGQAEDSEAVQEP